MAWRDRMQAYWLFHPRAAATAVVAFAVGVPAYDVHRLVDASTQAQVGWRGALGVGIVVGLVGLGVLVALYVALRAMGETAIRRAGYVGAGLVVLVFGTTHPRHGPETIGTWSSFVVLVAVDTCYLLGLLGCSVLVWRRPVPDVEVEANTRPRHGRRWKRRSAATRAGRPGGR